MSSIALPFWLVRQEFPSDTCLWEALLHPDCAALAGRGDSPAALLQRLQRVFEELPEDELARRFMVRDPELHTEEIVVEPPRRGVWWRESLQLKVQAAVWEHPGGNWIAYAPALRHYAVRAKRNELLSALKPEWLRALERRSLLGNLEQLTQLALVTHVALESHKITFKRLSPLQRLRRLHDEEEARRSVLRECVTERAVTGLPRALGRDVEANRLARLLTGRFSRPVLLVGPRGVGKTALLHEALARAATLPGPVWETDGLRLVSGMSGYGMWQERCQKVAQQARRAMAVLHLGGLAELANAGFSVGNEQGLGDWFAAAIPREGLMAVAECTPEQFSALERRFPRLVQVFERFDVDVPSDETVLAILQQETRSRFSEAALREVLHLHARFATESAAPGRPLRFVRNLLQDVRDHIVSAREVVAAFSQETGIPPVILDDEIPLEAHALQQSFAREVIGQGDAIDAVVDVIVRIKARLQRPGKPLATLLFTGPTGVGKTELAKAMARFFFSDERRMVRIDMSEYAHPAHAQRLFGGGGEREGVLTARVRENPFSLVLLDEFEKAHPAVFDLLLQVCGEGRLTDEAGRLADFRNTVIVLTSNLGAASFLKPTAGFGPSTQEADAEDSRAAAEHFAAEARKFLRPEMFNRLDAIVPFRPLPADVARRIVEREVEIAARRQGLSERRLGLQFSEAAVDRLLALGMDKRYGARPLKRALDRHVLVPVAELVSERAKLADRAIAVDAPGEAGFALTTSTDRAITSEAIGLSGPLALLADTRRRSGALFRNDQFRELLVEHQRLARRVAKLDQRREHSQPAAVVRQQFAALDAIVQEAHGLREEVARREDGLTRAALDADSGGSSHGDLADSREAEQLSHRLHELLRTLEARADSLPHDATWLAFCDDESHLRKVVHPQLIAAIAVLFRQAPHEKCKILRLRQRTIPNEARYRSLRRNPDPIACLQAGFLEATEINETPAEDAAHEEWSGIAIRIRAPFAWRLLRHAGAQFEVVVEDKRYRGQLGVLRGHPVLGGHGFESKALVLGQRALPSWTFERGANAFRTGSGRERQPGRDLGAWIAGELHAHYQRLLWTWIS